MGWCSSELDAEMWDGDVSELGDKTADDCWTECQAKFSPAAPRHEFWNDGEETWCFCQDGCPGICDAGGSDTLSPPNWYHTQAKVWGTKPYQDPNRIKGFEHLDAWHFEIETFCWSEEEKAEAAAEALAEEWAARMECVAENSEYHPCDTDDDCCGYCCTGGCKNTVHGCIDTNDSCTAWAELTPSECEVNPDFMNGACRHACDVDGCATGIDESEDFCWKNGAVDCVDYWGYGPVWC